MTRKKSKKSKKTAKVQNQAAKTAVPVTDAALSTGIPAANSTGTDTGSGGTNGDGEKKIKRRSVTFAGELYSVETALENSLNDPLIRQYVLEYGYTEERLTAGKQKASDARAKHESQQKLMAIKAECRRVVKEKQSIAEKAYKEFVRVIRLGFENQEKIIETLAISNPRKLIGEWVANTEIFYNNLLQLPEVLDFMAKLDFTREKVEAGKQLFEEVKKARVDLKNADGEAQKATEIKVDAFRKIRKWWRDYKKIVDIALEKDPQLKEKLGIATPMTV